VRDISYNLTTQNLSTTFFIFYFIGTTEQQNQLLERPPWQKLVSIFLAELIGTALLMFFGCMGLVPTLPSGELGPYSGAIAFAGIVAVVIVVSIIIYIYIYMFYLIYKI